MKNFFIKEEFSFFVLLYTFIKKDTILTLIYTVMSIFGKGKRKCFL